MADEPCRACHYPLPTTHYMTTSQLRWLLLLIVGLFSLSGASCPQMVRQYANPPPRVLPASPTLEQVIEVVNRNSSQIQSFSTGRASLSGSGFPSLTASVAFQRARRFRLQAGTGFGAELDLGSNDERFWFWVKRSQPPAIYFCRHDQFSTSQARKVTPFEPQWLIEALGVMEFDRALPHQMTLLPNDRIKIDTIRDTPDGPVEKVTIIDGSQGWVLEQHVYVSEQRGSAAYRRLVASAVASGHRRDPLTGLVMPTVVDINSPQAQLCLRIDLGNLDINRLADDRPALWTMPGYAGASLVDMGDPDFRLPEQQPTTAGVRRPVPPANRRTR
jgi:hypothetical protein